MHAEGNIHANFQAFRAAPKDKTTLFNLALIQQQRVHLINDLPLENRSIEALKGGVVDLKKSEMILSNYFNKELSEVLGLEIDIAGKFIIFHYSEGYPEEYWDTLQYKKNKLSRLKKIYSDLFIKTQIDQSKKDIKDLDPYKQIFENKTFKIVSS